MQIDRFIGVVFNSSVNLRRYKGRAHSGANSEKEPFGVGSDICSRSLLCTLQEVFSSCSTGRRPGVHPVKEAQKHSLKMTYDDNDSYKNI